MSLASTAYVYINNGSDLPNAYATPPKKTPVYYIREFYQKVSPFIEYALKNILKCARLSPKLCSVHNHKTILPFDENATGIVHRS